MAVIAQPIPVLDDNYVWLLREENTGAIAIVDPGEAAPVLAALKERGNRLDMILLTHHHGDHIDGVEAVKRAFPAAEIVGATADRHRLPKLDRSVADGDRIQFGSATGAVIETPGHTVGHISYFFADGAVLLCGDTLFSLGCGRLLEGDATQMFGSLQRLGALPDDTLVCCGHEYTQSNAKFALSVEGDNPDLIAQAADITRRRAADQPTLPSLLGNERKANPFLRAADAETLGTLRHQKDTFR